MSIERARERLRQAENLAAEGDVTVLNLKYAVLTLAAALDDVLDVVEAEYPNKHA